MGQASFKINSVVLRYYREKSKLSQCALAQLCNMTERHYQRIEKSGCTTEQTAGRIAKELDITIDTLLTMPENDDTLWYVTKDSQDIGQLENGYYDVI